MCKRSLHVFENVPRALYLIMPLSFPSLLCTLFPAVSS